VSEEAGRRHRAGEPIADLCRACKAERDHTIMAVDPEGRPIRVVCDFCGSQHNYRGGAGDAATPVRERERTAPSMPTTEPDGDLERLLRRVLREELGLTPLAPAAKWRGGEVVLRPGRAGLQEKTLPIDALFHKIVMIRNRLRTLEQQLNAAEIPDDLKLRLQTYISGCYGSLTSFNVLFADEADQFRGSGGAGS
jgi:hypothetical protein